MPERCPMTKLWPFIAACAVGDSFSSSKVKCDDAGMAAAELAVAVAAAGEATVPIPIGDCCIPIPPVL